MVSGRPSTSARTLAIRMFGDVPTSVTSPPGIDADAIGISSEDGDVPVRRASCIAAGMRIAGAPTFLLALGSAITRPTSTGTCTPTVGSRGVIGRIAASTIPERAIPALTTRAAAMMMTPSSEKPSNALCAGTTPTSSAATDTRSHGSLPHTKHPTVPATSAKDSSWSSAIGRGPRRRRR